METGTKRADGAYRRVISTWNTATPPSSCHSELPLVILSEAKNLPQAGETIMYHVFIMASLGKTLYVGVTNDLSRRVGEHKEGRIPGFTSRYGVNWLVWSEPFKEVRDAIACEKRIKGWTRVKKITLVEERNPEWLDLGANVWKA